MWIVCGFKCVHYVVSIAALSKSCVRCRNLFALISIVSRVLVRWWVCDVRSLFVVFSLLYIKCLVMCVTVYAWFHTFNIHTHKIRRYFSNRVIDLTEVASVANMDYDYTLHYLGMATTVRNRLIEILKVFKYYTSAIILILYYY